MMRTTVLLILDGWGQAPPSPGNAIALANPRCFNELWNTKPHTLLISWGTAVGLFEDSMGNSEVGHMNLGAGRIVKQQAVIISDEIHNGAFFTKPQWETVHALHANKVVHLIGLLSNGTSHARLEHLVATYDYFDAQNYTCYIHLFSDGRDSGIQDAPLLLQQLPDALAQRVATICGRFYGMDRDGHWDRTERAYKLISYANGKRFTAVNDALSDSYQQGLTDEFVEPAVIGDYAGIQPNDLLFMFNFREDRMRQLAMAYCLPDFNQFTHNKQSPLGCLTQFEQTDLERHTAAVYPKLRVYHTIADIIAEHGLTQLHVAESEKYAHVTYFFNGGREMPHVGEQSVIIPSPRVQSYAQTPAMSVQAVTDTVLKHIGAVNFIVVNFANADMVGHTGDLQAGIAAIAAIDIQLERLVHAVQANHGHLFITSDHGNAEVMIDPHTGAPDTKHNNNPSPFIYVGDKRLSLQSAQILGDVAKFVLATMNL